MDTTKKFYSYQRFLNYLRYLYVFYLKKTSVPFLYAGLGYILYAFLHGGLGWNFPDYNTISWGVNFFFLIVLVTTSVQIFSPLYSPHSSIQEYSLPVSMKERFGGNFIFYGVLMLGLIFLINIAGFFVLVALDSFESAENFIKTLWGNYDSYTLLNFFYVYIFFFAGSAYFRKSPIAKSLVCLAVIYVISLLIFKIPSLKTSIDLNNNGNQEFVWSFSQSENWLIKNSSILEEIYYYLFITIWFVGSYFKVKRSQFRI